MLKRAELILKSTKGLIVENARAVKHGSEAGGIEKFARSLVFVLPRLKGHASNTTGAAGSTAVSNLVVVDGRTIVANGRATLVFNTVRDRLTEIFRAQ